MKKQELIEKVYPIALKRLKVLIQQVDLYLNLKKINYEFYRRKGFKKRKGYIKI